MSDISAISSRKPVKYRIVHILDCSVCKRCIICGRTFRTSTKPALDFWKQTVDLSITVKFSTCVSFKRTRSTMQSIILARVVSHNHPHISYAATDAQSCMKSWVLSEFLRKRANPPRDCEGALSLSGLEDNKHILCPMSSFIRFSLVLHPFSLAPFTTEAKKKIKKKQLWRSPKFVNFVKIFTSIPFKV